MMITAVQEDANSRMREVEKYLVNLGMTLHRDADHVNVCWSGQTRTISSEVQSLLDGWVFNRKGVQWKVTQAIVEEFHASGWKR